MFVFQENKARQIFRNFSFKARKNFFGTAVFRFALLPYYQRVVVLIFVELEQIQHMNLMFFVILENGIARKICDAAMESFSNVN